MNTVVLAGSVIDGTGKDPIARGAVLVADGRIAAVGTASDIKRSPDTQVIDLGSRTVLPGLVDCHLHLWGRSPEDRHPKITGPNEYRVLRAAVEARNLLHAGFTAVRECGSNIGVNVRRGIDDGVIPGPRMKTAGMAIGRTGGPWIYGDPSWRFMRPADSLDECRKLIYQTLYEKSDFIKIGVGCGLGDPQGEVSLFTLEEMRFMVEEAHRWGVRVAVHAMNKQPTRNSVFAGVDTVEHGYGMDEETMAHLVKHQQILVPTLRIWGKSARETNDVRLNRSLETARAVREAGGIVAAGSDTTGGIEIAHGPGNAVEMELLTQAGFSPIAAIQAGTRNAAMAMGMGNVIGTLEVGKFADICAVPGDPLSELSLLQRVDFVMKGGEVIVGDGRAKSGAAREEATRR